MSFFQILNFTTTLQRFLITGFAGSFRVSSNQTLHSYPTVNIVNGSYMGIHNEIYNQHLFLGIPYAQPPVGNLRFRAPISLNTTWNGTREAVKYSDICVGYGPDSDHFNSSEDCLTLNVIRPTIAIDEPLPIIVWIHGGGLVQGSSADPRYNLSYLVHQSVLISKPIIGISLNYRLSSFGFLWSQEVKDHGTGNLGLRDQRLALHWIQENISAFGGDPKKVTLWGESSGGYSVGKQIIAYGGRNDDLFRGAIMQSGFLGENWPYGIGNADEYNEALYQELIARTGCFGQPSSLECLRALPLEELNRAQNSSATEVLGPWVIAIDGDFVQELGSLAMKSGRFVKIPILLGTNTDEGTSAAPRKGIDTDTEFEVAVALAGIDPDTIKIITHLYPDIDAIGIPKTYHPSPDIVGLGKQYKRSAAFFGDAVEHAPRRLTSISWSKHNQKAYTFRWNIIPNGVPDYVGATHFAEIPWAFGNLDGVGYDTNPFGDSQRYREISKLMNGMWISFVVDQDPNLDGIDKVPHWPAYDAITGGVGQNFVFEGNESHHVEIDDWGADGIALVMERAASQWKF